MVPFVLLGLGAAQRFFQLPAGPLLRGPRGQLAPVGDAGTYIAVEVAPQPTVQRPAPPASGLPFVAVCAAVPAAVALAAAAPRRARRRPSWLPSGTAARLAPRPRRLPR